MKEAEEIASIIGAIADLITIIGIPLTLILLIYVGLVMPQ
jgi:uncharacterized membrane protein YccF (DUF307 family)